MKDKNKPKRLKSKDNNIQNEIKDFKQNKKRRKDRKRERLENRTPEQIKRIRRIKLLIGIIAIIIILCLGIKSAITLNNFKNLMSDMSNNNGSIVVDSEGKTIATIGEEKSKEKVNFEDIPNNLKNAYISIEDQRFYSHHGVDIKRTGSAIFSYVLHRGSSSFGGSTITQQLIKNLTGDSSSKVSRKIKEWGEATVLEGSMTKDEIMELYLNVIYVGPNIYGVETGSKYYFNKSVKNLSLAECAFLGGINNSPNSYNPFECSTTNTEKINKRTKTVLAKMLELKYITESEYDVAISEVESGMKFKKGNISSDDAVYSYHIDALISQVIEDISEKNNISETFATNYLNMAGATIYSTQNSQIQTEIETEFEKSKYQLKSKLGNDSSQAAMVVIDHSTGQVIGCVGGLGEKTTSRGFNRATQSTRQTGSSIKPIAVLVPGIAKRIFTGATIFNDEETEFAEGYSPKNYSKYLGDITVRRAVSSSQNIPFVKMMEEVTPKKSIKYLKKMGITTLTEKDENLALALGGLDKGISPLQMAEAYATIANDGIHISPTFYTKVVNNNNKTVLTVKQKRNKVFSKEVAYIIKELLTEPVTSSSGTATYCSISGMDVAAKTGTTDENYDRWLCGFTPYYSAVAWYGYDQNETISYNGNKNPAGILWANIMTKIHSNLASAKFEKPQTVVEVKICADTGCKANSGCSNTYTEYFLLGTTPKVCNKHAGTEIKEDSNTKNDIKNVINSVTDSFDTTTKEDLDSVETNSHNTKNTTNTVKEKDNNTTNNYSTNTTQNTINTTTQNSNTTNTNQELNEKNTINNKVITNSVSQENSVEE